MSKKAFTGGMDMLKMLANSVGEGVEPEVATSSSTLPIDHILPDPAQPRRALPEDLRARWLRQEDMGHILGIWADLAYRAAEDAVSPWRQIIAGTFQPPDDSSDIADLPPVAQHWMELVRLASSVYRVGLEQAVAVYDDGNVYRLLYGERRLLAFHLLRWCGYQGFDAIPASQREHDDLAVWRQAFENGARQNLNAIGKARQLALLLMTLNHDKVQPFRGDQPEWEWYAQAADLSIPYGRSEDVATIMGMNTRAHISLYRRLLTLPPQVALLADEYDLTEGALRSMMREAGEDRQQLLTIARVAAGLEKASRSSDDAYQQIVKREEQVLKAIQGFGLPDTKTPSSLRKAKAEALRKIIDQASKALHHWEK